MCNGGGRGGFRRGRENGASDSAHYMILLMMQIHIGNSVGANSARRRRGLFSMSYSLRRANRGPLATSLRGAGIGIVALALATLGQPAAMAQTSLTGSSMALRSLGSATLSSPGYLGTYLNVPAGGATIDFTVRATRGATGNGTAPHMNLAIADSRFGIDVTSTSATNYGTPTVTLPAGRYFVRAERDYDHSSASSHALTVNNLTVNTVAGAAVTFSNVSNDANAFASADTYIENFRKGPATVKLVGASPGTPVSVNLKRIDFNFGTAVPGFNTSGVNSLLGSPNNTQRQKYQATLNQNFNSLAAENIGKWGHNEGSQGSVSMGGVDAYLNYAAAHNMTARTHNLLWGPTSGGSNQQPNWVVNLIASAAAGDATAKANLTNAITNRINYYVGGMTQRALKYSEIDVFNESYHTGQNNSHPSDYWDVYQASGIADIYNQVAAAIAAAGADTKTFVNEYNVFQNAGTYATYYSDHIHQIRNAGGNVGGVGIQYYPNAANGTGSGNGQHSPARIVSVLQGLSVDGLPLSLNEFAVNGTAPTDATPNPDTMANATKILSDTMRLMFGTQQATGFYMWGFHSQNNNGAGAGDNLYLPAAALYAVNTTNWNTWTITNAGKAYEDLLGVKEWDGVLGNGWTTQLDGRPIIDGNGSAIGNNPAAPIVDSLGNIDFTGYYGEYQVTVGRKTFLLDLRKGVTSYVIEVPEPTAGLALVAMLPFAVLIRRHRRTRKVTKSLHLGFVFGDPRLQLLAREPPRRG